MTIPPDVTLGQLRRLPACGEVILAIQSRETDHDLNERKDRLYRSHVTTPDYRIAQQGDTWDSFLGCRKSQVRAI